MVAEEELEKKRAAEEKRRKKKAEEEKKQLEAPNAHQDLSDGLEEDIKNHLTHLCHKLQNDSKELIQQANRSSASFVQVINSRTVFISDPTLRPNLKDSYCKL